jgi:hypothetical protein
MKTRYLLLTIFMFGLTPGIFAQADMKETIAMIKTNLATSKENMKKYAWIETTTTFVKGEKKSVKQNQCYYSLDGQLTKVETGGSEPAKKKGGIRGKIAENKKDDMMEYVKAAITKIQTYLPPDGAKIQQIYGAGKTNVQVLEPGKKFKLSFPDYNVQGDLLSLSVNTATKKIMAADVSTYIDDPKEKVVFNVTFKDLPDGTQYTGETTLNAEAKKLKIVIVNSGYKKASGQ